MAKDKITISMDDVNSATPVPGPAASPVFTPGYAPSESNKDSKPKRTGLFVGIGVAAVALCCIIGIGVMAVVDPGPIPPPTPKERTVSDYRAETMREIEAELAKPDSKCKKRIEDAHITVTVKSTEIVRCDVTTLDGSDTTGKDDSNIDKVSTLIRFYWTGIIDAGYTDLRIVYDVQNQRLLKSEIEYTTAIANVEDPDFWLGVGALLMSL